jgi:small-conductance mechanosensitive channel
LTPYQLPTDVFWTILPYVELLAFLIVALLVARFVASRTGRVARSLLKRFGASEEIAELVGVILRLVVWTVAAILVVTAVLVQFGLGQFISESISLSLSANASRIVLIALTIVISYIIVRLIHLFLVEFRSRTKLHPFTIDLLERVATYFIYAAAGLLVVTNILVAAGLATIAGSLVTLFAVLIGLVVSFAATGSIGNALAGIVLMSWRPYREGDRVDLGGGTYGDVVEVDVMFTKIRTIKDEMVHVPNLLVLGNKVMNYSALGRCILHQEITIGYDIKWTTVEGLLLRAAAKTDGILKDPQPFVLVRSLDNYYVTYEVNGYTSRQRELVRIQSDVMKNILECFDEANVEILSPQYVTLREPNPSVKRRDRRGTIRVSQSRSGPR